jgi:uncharacterized membrane protein
MTDLLANYGSGVTWYNSGMLNRGSWFCHIPGWTMPNGCRMAEPFLFSSTWYSFGFLGAVILGCRVLRWVKARNPALGTLGLLAVGLGIAVVADVVVEFIYIFAGIYFYGSPIKGATVFAGHYYQFPLYEAILWPVCWVALVCIRYYRDDKGQAFCERGLDRVHVSAPKKAFLSMFSIPGMVATFYIAYMVPWWGMSTLHPGSFPADIQKRSYFTNGVCGPATQFACPSAQLPTNRSGTFHIDPEGRLIPGNSHPSPPVLQFSRRGS